MALISLPDPDDVWRNFQDLGHSTLQIGKTQGKPVFLVLPQLCKRGSLWPVNFYALSPTGDGIVFTKEEQWCGPPRFSFRQGFHGRLSHMTGDTLHFLPGGGPFPERFRYVGLDKRLPRSIVDQIAEYLEMAWDPEPPARQVTLEFTSVGGPMCNNDCEISHCGGHCYQANPIRFQLFLDNEAVNWDVPHQLHIGVAERKTKNTAAMPVVESGYHRRLPAAASSEMRPASLQINSGNSEGDEAFAAEAVPVIQEVLHDEAAARIPASEAAAIQQEIWVSAVQQLASTAILPEPGEMSVSDDDDFHVVTVADEVMAAAMEPKLAAMEAYGSMIDKVTFRSSTSRRRDWLLECRELEPVRAELQRAGCSCYLDEACIFVPPCDLPAVRETLRSHVLQKHDVIVSKEFRLLLNEALEAGRNAGRLGSQDCRIRGTKSLVLQALPQGMVVKNTFLHYDSDTRVALRDVDACTNSTTALHGSTSNPRCFSTAPRKLTQRYFLREATLPGASVCQSCCGDGATSCAPMQCLEPKEVSTEQLLQCTLPKGWSRTVYMRVLELVDRCPHSVLVLIAKGGSYGGPKLGAPRSPEVERRWKQLRLDVFDELPNSALEDWCRDGLVVVHPKSGRVDGITRSLVVNEDEEYTVEGGLRTSRAFLAARFFDCVTVCKKFKPERQGAVQVGWTSIFSTPLVQAALPRFLRHYGSIDAVLPASQHETAKPLEMRQSPDASLFSRD
eukprot:TRINITY_DN12704_c0_g1_i1.p1 TRINITY_DN12704_c0_g1~~TRINITY_DN12704_c0_g1_i1.p1  ORF type:complete len:756 (-),score=121.72 TRINITY_DN12704_c0_g1_i1:264-2453(-)